MRQTVVFTRINSIIPELLNSKIFCSRLRKDVYSMLDRLGYHPQLGKKYVRLARKGEVYNFKELINFRDY